MSAEFTKAQREACWNRSGGYCEACGCRLRPQGWNLHHRQGRGMGGTRRKVTCSDGLVICGMGNTSGCHRLMDTQREWAVARGYVVSRGSLATPREVPVLRFGDWVWLLEDGSVESLPTDLANAYTGALIA